MAGIVPFLRVVLAALLATAALAKGTWLLHDHGWSHPAGVYALAAVAELALAGLLVWPRSAVVCAWLTAGGFLGAASATLAFSALYGARASCRCLGAVEMTRGQAMLVQGVIIGIAGLSLYLEPRRNTPSAA